MVVVCLDMGDVLIISVRVCLVLDYGYGSLIK